MQSENYVTLVKLQSRRSEQKITQHVPWRLGYTSIVKYGTCDFTNRPKALIISLEIASGL